ncbi:hypothetical protein BK126_06985 [Paenibacillus sp. FSL H7-0326]|nr:hypothetical protein BK126_06985 [Paenibacillus sp. FSL H7-0326]
MIKQILSIPLYIEIPRINSFFVSLIFDRGCLWLILGAIGILVLSFITQSTINIPWFIFIPVVILVFWIASKKSKK